MLSLLAARWVEAYRSPRASARRILASAPTAGESVSMAVAGFALATLGARLAELATGVTMQEAIGFMSDRSPEQIAAAEAAARSLGGVLEQFLTHMIEFLAAAVLGWRLGAAVGGVARFDEVLALAGWWALAAAAIQIVIVLIVTLTAMSGNGIAQVAMIVGALYVFYLFAAFLAEAHGFESEAAVFVSSLGVLLGVFVLILLVAGGAPGA